MSVINLRELKKELRKKHLRIRENCPPDLKKQLDNQIFLNFIQTDEYKNCETLFAFVSMNNEVDTSRILENALSLGKRIALPRCKDKNGEMTFYYVTDLSQLEKGMFSLMEPSLQKCTEVTDFSHGLCIVPGLCFDLHGYRIGFGKGYYDRFLQDFGGTSVGLCYGKCIENTLPKGRFDKAVDIIITEKFVSRLQGDD